MILRKILWFYSYYTFTENTMIWYYVLIYPKIYQTLVPILIDKTDKKTSNTLVKTDAQFQKWILEKHTEFEKLLKDIDKNLVKEFFDNAFEFFEDNI